MKAIYQLIIIKSLKRITNPTLINFMKTPTIHSYSRQHKITLAHKLQKLKKTRTKHYQFEAQIFFHPLVFHHQKCKSISAVPIDFI